MEIIGTTHCWNTQQGCMAQWLAPDFKNKIIYNDFRDNKFVSVVYNFKTKKEERVYDRPIYDIARSGEFALSLDFTRLHRLRRGYGYANILESTRMEKCPDQACIWRIDLKTGIVEPILKYTDLIQFETRNEMLNAEHKVNHIMISPDCKRFMFLHRWFKHNKKFTRLITANIDGSDMYNLSDDDFVSHCCWKNDGEILAFLRKKGSGDHYYLMKDKTNKYKLFWDELKTDGHCTYSYDKKYVITDTYPNRKRIASVYLCEEDKKSTKITSVFAPFKYDGDVRCDLHPRWDHQNKKICIDSVHEGKKEIYVINLNNHKNQNEKIPRIIHSVWVGNGKKSEIVKRCEESWKIYCPGYKMIEWNESNFDISTACQYVKDAYKAKKWAFVSDYIRLKVLYEYGGIYLDTDSELIKNIDAFLTTDGFLCTESHATLSLGIICVRPKEKWVKELIDQYDSAKFFSENGTPSLLPINKRVQRFFEDKYNYCWSNKIQTFRDGFTVFPSEYFSPINPYTGKKRITENTYMIHHYDNTWKGKKDKILRKIMQLCTRITGEDFRIKIVNIKNKSRRK